MSNKTPEYTLNAVKTYNNKLIYHKFSAKQDSERGKLMAIAKQDKALPDKFWAWLESEYKTSPA